jgi:uncharacterized protein (DUF58 family)
MAQIWIFLDAEASVQAEEPYSPPSEAVEATWSPWREIQLPPSTEEYGVTIAASLAQHFIRRDRAVGLVSYQHPARGAPDVLPPDRGGRQFGKILEALAPLRAEGELSISALVTAHAQHIPRGSTIIVITPSVDGEVTLAADMLVQRGFRPVVVLLDAASFGGSEGTAQLSDAIAALGVRVCVVAKGDDLATRLSFEMDTPGVRPTLRPLQVTRGLVRS